MRCGPLDELLEDELRLLVSSQAVEIARLTLERDKARADAEMLARALGDLFKSYTRAPVGSGDGGTYIVEPPTGNALRGAAAALAQHRGSDG